MIPAPAHEILTLIRVTETGRADHTAYETVYGHNEAKLTKPLTSMTLSEVQHWQPGFTKSFGSSATGAYQFMYATLKELIAKLQLTGHELFIADMQDTLGYELLKRRGYQPWVEARTSTDTFMIGLAKEWASFPVPSRMKGAHRMVERGQSFYAGDGVNKALVGPDVVWLVCEEARDIKVVPPPPEKPVKPEEPVEIGEGEVTLTAEEWRFAFDTFLKALSDPKVRDALAEVMKPEEPVAGEAATA